MVARILNPFSLGEDDQEYGGSVGEGVAGAYDHSKAEEKTGPTYEILCPGGRKPLEQKKR